MCSPSVFSEEYPPIREEDALAKWAADPANTAWMESKETIPSKVKVTVVLLRCHLSAFASAQSRHARRVLSSF